jgi:hypothetical protein
MTTALKLRVSALIEGYYQGSNDIAAPSQPFAKRAAALLTTGTSADQADLVFADTRTLAASATENLDLAGSLVDAFGNTLTFVEVCAILIVASDANTNDVVVGGAASNAFSGIFGDATDKLVVKPGGMALIAAPVNPAYAVVAATGDILKVANSAGGTGVTYDIVIIGRSA